MVNGGAGRNRTGVHGVAVRCMTTLPPSHNLVFSEGELYQNPYKSACVYGLIFYHLTRPESPLLVAASGPAEVFGEIGAGNETRTRDPDLGKVVLYQLSYSRKIGLQR